MYTENNPGMQCSQSLTMEFWLAWSSPWSFSACAALDLQVLPFKSLKSVEVNLWVKCGFVHLHIMINTNSIIRVIRCQWKQYMARVTTAAGTVLNSPNTRNVENLFPQWWDYRCVPWYWEKQTCLSFWQGVLQHRSCLDHWMTCPCRYICGHLG